MEEEPSTLEAWREVHSTLLKACELAQESVNTQKMQYRFLLEEINANLTTDGHLTATSVWTQPKKPNLNNRRKPPTATSGKRKRKASSETAVKKTAVDLSSMDSAADNASSRGYSSDAKTPRSQQHKPKKIKISLKNSRLDSSTGKMKNLTEKSRKDAEEESAATAHHLSNVASHAVYAEEATHAVLTASGAPVQSLNEYIPSASTTSAMGDQHPSYDSHASAAVYNAAMVAPGQLVAPTLQLPLHISGTETASPVQQAALQQHPHLQQHQQHLAASLAMTAQQPQNPLQMMVGESCVACVRFCFRTVPLHVFVSIFVLFLCPTSYK